MMRKVPGVAGTPEPFGYHATGVECANRGSDVPQRRRAPSSRGAIDSVDDAAKHRENREQHKRNYTTVMPGNLSLRMTPQQFENGYWYATELKAFAKTTGIPLAGKLRKDELEAAILQLLRSGELTKPPRNPTATNDPADPERGLHLRLPVVKFRNDPETWDFIEREARKMSPGMKRRSGAKYRLNRWRDARLAEGTRITYRDLIAEYVRLSTDGKPFQPIPSGRYINFARDYFAPEDGATFRGMLRAWKEVKKLDAPKEYKSWVTLRKRS